MRRFVICFVLLFAASAAMAQTDPGAPDSVIVAQVASATGKAQVTIWLSNGMISNTRPLSTRAMSSENSAPHSTR